MTLEQALDIMTDRTGHGRYRWLCSPDNPDAESRAAYRRLVLDQAGAPPPPAPISPPAPPPPSADDLALRRLLAAGSCCG